MCRQFSLQAYKQKSIDFFLLLLLDKFSNLHFVCSFHNSDYRRYSRNAFRWTWLLNTQGQEDSPSLCRGEVAMPLGPKHHLSTTYEIFPRFSLRRHHCDYFINQVLMEHGTFDDHQARLKNNLRCPCGTPFSMIQHFLYVCERWRTLRKAHFRREYQIRKRKDFCLDQSDYTLGGAM